MKQLNDSPTSAVTPPSISPEFNSGDEFVEENPSGHRKRSAFSQSYLPELDPNDPAIASFFHSARMAPLADDELKLHEVGRDYHDLPAEVGLITAMLVEPKRVIKKVIHDLSSEVFYDPRNWEICNAIVELVAAGTPVDRRTVVLHLQRNGAETDYDSHLDRLCQVSYNPAHVGAYMDRLKEAERYRGGETYARYGFSEPFCAFLFRLRVGLLKCVAGIWYHYDAGVWKETNRHEFRPAAMRSVHPRHRQSKRFTQVLDYVESAYQVPAGTLCGAYKRVAGSILVNVDNGVLEVDAGGRVALGPHSPDHRFTLKVPTPYLPAATCPVFKQLIRQALPDPRDRLLLRAFAGYLLLPSCELEAALVCYGAGGSGKSTTWEAIKSVLGTTLCGSATLEQLCQSSGYTLPMIRNKMLNLGAEVSSKEVDESTNFKLLVSGEGLVARQIYCAPEEFSSVCKLVFLSNNMPFFRAGSDAEERRLRILPFDQKPVKKDTSLKAKVAEEAPGVLNWMLQGLVYILRRGAIPMGGAAAQQALGTFRQYNNPVNSFVAERCRLDPQASVKKETLRDEFKEWCEDNGHNGQKMGDYFFRILKQRFGVTPSKPTINGKKVPHLSGLALVGPADEIKTALLARMNEVRERAGQTKQAGQAG